MGVKSILKYFSYAFYLMKQEGIISIVRRTIKWGTYKRKVNYSAWIKRYETSGELVSNLNEEVLFCIMVVINMQDSFENYKRDLEKSILSIKEQLYQNYKIVIILTLNMYQRNIHYFKQYKTNLKIYFYFL